jgi:hypothetical protein
MTFWTFLDRNGFCISCLVFVVVSMATCGAPHSGCTLHIGPTTVTSASASVP